MLMFEVVAGLVARRAKTLNMVWSMPGNYQMSGVDVCQHILMVM